VGDVRSLPLLAAVHASVELHRAGAGTPRERLRRRVEARAATDPELVLDPAFFTALAQRLPGVAGVAGIEILLRRGRHRNEMTRFRYDAVLHIESRTEDGARPPAGLAGPPGLDWEAGGLSLAELRRRLAEEEPARLAVQRIPNDRVAADARALALLRQSDGPRTAGEIAQAAAGPAGAANAVDPEDLWSLAHGLGYETGVTWSRDPERVDAVFLRRREGAPRQPLPGLQPPSAAGQALASDPLGRRRARQLAPRLKAFAAERLPAPLVPADVVVLDELPLTSRGKVDLAALPAPEREMADLSAGFIAPRTFEERAVASLWADLLGVDQVGAEDDFFALGGHSLLATQVLARLRQETGVELELREIFAAPTVAGLAAALAARREAAEGRRAGGARGGSAPEAPRALLAPLAPTPRASGPTALPLSPGQRRLWFLHRFDPAAAAYNMAGAFRLSGRLDAAALAQALGEIARRHEVLRTTYALAGEEPVQVVPPLGAPAGLPWTLPFADLSALPASRREAEARRLAAEEGARPFDLARGPVWRGALVRLGRREHLALVTIHHIAADGWSSSPSSTRPISPASPRPCPSCRSSTATSRPGSSALSPGRPWRHSSPGGGSAWLGRRRSSTSPATGRAPSCAPVRPGACPWRCRRRSRAASPGSLAPRAPRSSPSSSPASRRCSSG
jgi:acyl carrier protein